MPDKKKKIAVCAALCMVMAAAVIVEVLFAKPHYRQLWNTVPGADILIGFAGAWLIIFAAKIVMNRLLRRGEDYYEGSDDSDD